ncbi:hypothetical protein [Bartonella sp. MM97QHHN]|uniref:hypothetical protein n=1 Tax=Bartonella sp. MM97QHHN TaxID=3243553 RepID=UPI0035CF9AC7
MVGNGGKGAWNEDKAYAGGENENETGWEGILCSVEERQSSIKRKEQRGKRVGFYVGGGCQTGEAGSIANLGDRNVKAWSEMGERVLGMKTRRMLEGKTRMRRGGKGSCVALRRGKVL